MAVVKRESVTDKALNGLLWFIGGKGAQSALQFGVLVVLARTLTPSDFGLINAAMIFIGFAQIATQMGMGPALVQRPELTQEHLNTSLTLAIGLSIPLGLVTFCLAPLMAAAFDMPSLTNIVRTLGVIFPITALGMTADAMLLRDLRFRAISTLRILSYFIGYAVIGLIMALCGFGVWALVVAQIAQSTVNSLGSVMVKRVPARIGFSWTAAADLLNYGAGMSLARIANYGAEQADKVVVGRGLGEEALGLYGRAQSLMLLPATIIGEAIGQVLFPAMSSVQNDSEKLLRAYYRATAGIAMLVLPMSGVLLILGPEIIRLVLGPGWAAAVAPFQLLSIFMIFRVSYRLSDVLSRALGAVYQRAWRSLSFAIAVLLGALVGQNWGTSGVAVGVGFATIMNYVLMLRLAKRLINISVSRLLAIHVRYIIPAALLTGCAFLTAHSMRIANAHHIAIVAMTLSVSGAVVTCGYVTRRFWMDESGREVIGIIQRKISNVAKGRS